MLLATLAKIMYFVYTYEKSAEPVLSLVPRYKGSRIARQVETSNANTTSNLMQHLKRQENVRKC